MMGWFWNEASGLKADIERHRKQEQDLDEKIKQLESIENPTPMEITSLRVYRNFRAKLLQSKAEVTSKIGKR